MTIESGKYYAVPVHSGDPEFEIDFDVNPELRVITAQRMTEADAPQTPADEIDQLKNQVKDGIAGLKKGGWKGALSMVKNLAADSMKDEKQKLAEKKAAEFKDPMDPNIAFALDVSSRVKYEPIHSLENKEKDTELFQFRSDTSYGVLQRLEGGLMREIVFTYPGHEYAEKNYPEKHVGHSVPDWRREDDELHRMRVYYLSTDKTKAQAKASTTNLGKEKEEHFSVDMGSSRNGERTRFSAPRLKLDPRTAELGFNFIDAWYLPKSTQAGRQIQYNWDALRVTVTQEDEIIRRRVCWSSKKGHEYIGSVNTNMELMQGGYIGELKEGHYQLRVSVYNDEVLCYPFEVKKIESTDKLSDPATYYVLNTPVDDYAKLNYLEDSKQLNINYPLRTLAEKHGSEEVIRLSCKVMRDGEVWPQYALTEVEADGLFADFDVRNTPGWTEKEQILYVPFGTSSVYAERQAVPDGVYTLFIEVNGVPESEIDFEVKDGKLIMDNVPFPDLPMADFEFPEEHQAYLFKIRR